MTTALQRVSLWVSLLDFDPLKSALRGMSVGYTSDPMCVSSCAGAMQNFTPVPSCSVLTASSHGICATPLQLLADRHGSGGCNRRYGSMTHLA